MPDQRREQLTEILRRPGALTQREIQAAIDEIFKVLGIHEPNWELANQCLREAGPGGVITAVKLFRDYTGADLRTAVDTIKQAPHHA